MSKEKPKQDTELAEQLATINLSIKALHRARSKGQLSPNDQHLLTLNESMVQVISRLAIAVQQLAEVSNTHQHTLDTHNKTTTSLVELLQKMTGVDVQANVSENHDQQDAV